MVQTRFGTDTKKSPLPRASTKPANGKKSRRGGGGGGEYRQFTSSFLSRRVVKKFGDAGVFAGKVVSYKKPFYRIVYEDGDSEEMRQTEVSRHLHINTIPKDVDMSGSSAAGGEGWSADDALTQEGDYYGVGGVGGEEDRAEIERRDREEDERRRRRELIVGPYVSGQYNSFGKKRVLAGGGTSSSIILGDSVERELYAIRKQMWNMEFLNAIYRSGQLDACSSIFVIDGAELGSARAIHDEFGYGSSLSSLSSSSATLPPSSRVTIANMDSSITAMARQEGFGVFCGKAEQFDGLIQFAYFDFCCSFFKVCVALRKRLLENLDPRRPTAILFCTFCLRCGDKKHSETKKAIRSFFMEDSPLWSPCYFRLHKTDGVNNMVVVEVHYSRIMQVSQSFSVDNGLGKITAFLSTQCFHLNHTIEQAYYHLDQRTATYTFPPLPAEKGFTKCRIVAYSTWKDSVTLQEVVDGHDNDDTNDNDDDEDIDDDDRSSATGRSIEVPWRFFSLPTGPLLFVNAAPKQAMLAEFVATAAFFCPPPSSSTDITGIYSRNHCIPLGQNNYGAWYAHLDHKLQTAQFHQSLF